MQLIGYLKIKKQDHKLMAISFTRNYLRVIIFNQFMMIINIICWHPRASAALRPRRRRRSHRGFVYNIKLYDIDKSLFTRQMHARASHPPSTQRDSY